MEIVGGLDLHRQQITFELVDRGSGEVRRGRLWQPDRARLRRWLGEEVGVRAQGRRVRLAMEGCTGWRFVAEEIAAGGFEALVAEPAEVQARRGPKRRAKTDRADARLLRELLEQRRVAVVVGAAAGGVGVAGTDPAVQDVVGSTHGVDTAAARRTVPARRRRARSGGHRRRDPGSTAGGHDGRR